MENLDGKYFENVILALKKAKDSQKIEIRPDFKQQLRAEIINHAATISTVEKTDWADFILRYKYILGGVPVLAVITIVAINALNFQVKLPNSADLPGTLSEKTLLNQGESKSNQINLPADTTSEGEPKLKTFSADSVMPPADVLQKYLQQVASRPEQTAESTSKQLPYTFLSGINLKLAFPPINSGSTQPLQNIDGSQPAPDQQEQSRQVTFSDVPAVTTGVKPEEVLTMPQEKTARVENSGRIEQSGTVDNQISAQQSLPASQTIASPQTTAVSEENPPISVPDSSVSNEQPLQTLKMTTPVAPPVGLTTIPEIRTQSTQPMNPAQELIKPAPKVNVQYSDLGQYMPQYLTKDRIVYRGSDSEKVIAAVMKGFADRNGTLSPDYNIQIMLLENGNYKATLFEYGKVKEVLVMTWIDGQLSVVTEIYY